MGSCFRANTENVTVQVQAMRALSCDVVGHVHSNGMNKARYNIHAKKEYKVG